MIQSYVTRIAFILIPVFMLSMQSVSAQAQNIDPTHGTAAPAVRPGSPVGAYEMSDFETINPYNGSLNFRLTLAQVGGRTGAPQSIILPIQRHWVVTRKADPNPGCPECYRDGIQSLSDDYPQYLGVKVSVKNMARQSSVATCNCLGQICDFAPWVESLSHVYVTMPDGTEYEMRDQATGGRPFSTFTCRLTQEPSRGNIFVTADGTSATFIADSPIIDRLGSYVWEQNGGQLESPLSGVLKLKDGTTYRVSNGRAVEIVDRNGNKISLIQGPSHDPNVAIELLTRGLPERPGLSGFRARV
jgi:hypothetical protein